MELALREGRGPRAELARKVAVGVLIVAAVFLVYQMSNRPSVPFYEFWRPELYQFWKTDVGLDWYKHYVYLADAMRHGTFDVASVGIPDYYQDLVRDGNSKYLPYQPAPAVLLLPFVAIWGTHLSEVYFSMVLGAVNVALFWYILTLLNVSRTTKILMVPFFALGTAHFYAATTGTLWFYNHVAAVFFLLMAIVFLLRRTSPVVPALFLAFAFLSRQSTILATPFFLYWIVRQHYPSVLNKEALLSRQSLYPSGLFLATLLPFVGFTLWYNAVRFGGIFDTGLGTVYDSYAGIRYSFYLNQFPDAPRFDMFDIRNILLHLYTIFLMPPDFHPDWSIFRPSPYGMSVLLTSPPFVYAALVKRDHVLKPACWMAISLVSIPVITYFSQGWVQFGYRYMLDFMPFLLILTALGFEDHQSPGSTRIKVLLVAIAIVAGFWGRYWGTKLGW